MEKIWYKFGKGILNYYAEKGIFIKYITNSPKKILSGISGLTQYRIYFVIEMNNPFVRNFVRDIRYTCKLIRSYQIFVKALNSKLFSTETIITEILWLNNSHWILNLPWIMLH